MRRSAHTVLLLGCTLGFWLASSTQAAPITLATGVNSDPPYVYGNLEIVPENPGITIEILQRVEARTGLEFVIGKRPWARVVHDVKNNHIDGGFHFSYKPERAEFVAYPIPEGATTPDPRYSISNRSYLLYRLKGNTLHWNGAKLLNDRHTPFTVAAIRGGSVTGLLKEQGYHLVEVETDLQMIDLLLAERIDGFVGIDNMLDAKIASLAPEDRDRIEKVPPAVRNQPYYIAFSKAFYQARPDAAWAIWQAIESIKNSGELIKLFEHYAVINKREELAAIQAEIEFLKKYRQIENEAEHDDEAAHGAPAPPP